jgi:hypothetical protein
MRLCRCYPPLKSTRCQDCLTAAKLARAASGTLGRQACSRAKMSGARATMGVMSLVRRIRLAGIVLAATGCAHEPASRAPAPSPPGRALIEQAIPRGVPDRAGWSEEMEAAFAALGLTPTPENVCAVVAVTAQESGFHTDPVIPDLGAVAWREIDRRAAHDAIPASLVHQVLELKSPTGRSYAERIDRARTEKELSDIFEDFTGSIPLGRSLFASWNPIRTRGPMQVNVAFAEQFAAAHRYPYPVKQSIADELFTRRGSLYFGIAHLLDYQAPYDRYLYRFADFNAGQYASRNAAFQRAVSAASGQPLEADGALLPGGGGTGHTELAVRMLSGRLHVDEAAIHAALEQGKSEGFERTTLYQAAFALAARVEGRPLPRAVVPQIRLEGPKISRNLTTDWYARRVDERFRRCLAR